mmetsp:Transcript_18033/g.27952  ORF Transcript_18033/g.27952 Transcript_18033/m.27952 type:complete len:87 (-) Transcript_18033:326-586(-)
MFPRFPRRLEFQHDECMDGQAPEDWCCNCAKAAGWDNIDPQLMYVRHACQSCRDSYYNSFGARPSQALVCHYLMRSLFYHHLCRCV